MTRKKQPEGQSGPTKAPSLNALIHQLEDPRSLISFLPEGVRSALFEIPDEWLAMGEEQLLTMLKEQRSWEPSIQVETLRVNFWLEYDRVQFSRVEKVMSMPNIFLGVCSERHFWNLVGSVEACAFILSRPIAYQATYESLQQLSNRKFHQILSLPIKEGGKINVKLLELQMKAAAMVDLRNKGGYLNRSETKNLTMLQQKTEHTYSHALTLKVDNKPAGEIEADIQEQLKKLEEEARMQLPPPVPQFAESQVVVDAEYTDVTKRDE